MKKTLFCFLILLILSSCAVSTVLDINQTSNSSCTQIEATDFFSRTLEDLSSFKRDQSNKSLLQSSVDSFVNQLEASPFAFGISSDGCSFIRFDFDDFNALVKSLSDNANQNVLTFENNRLELNISMDNYNQVKALVPFLAQEDIEVYCAEYNTDYTEEDYLTMMEFIAGDGAREGILSSNMEISVNTPSEIKSTNGIKVSDTSVVFRFGLIDFLLLKENISFYCEF